MSESAAGVMTAALSPWVARAAMRTPALPAKPQPLAGRGERALLALLALSPGKAVAITTLIDALWNPGDLPHDPANALQLRVSKLRRALSGLGASELVHRDGAGYRLGADPGDVDAYRFAGLIQSARGCGDAEHAVAAYDQALALWRAEPLADFAGEAWTIVEAARLTELRLAAVGERAERMLTLGRYEQVAADLQPIVAEAPRPGAARGSIDDRPVQRRAASRSAQGVHPDPASPGRRARHRPVAGPARRHGADPPAGPGHHPSPGRAAGNPAATDRRAPAPAPAG